MKETTYTTTKLVLTKEEKLISKSWKPFWSKFKKSQLITIGTWSGYNSNQRKIVHTDFCPQDDYLSGVIEYTDGTTLSVSTILVDQKDIISRELKRIQGYNELITKLSKSDTDYYKVS